MIFIKNKYQFKSTLILILTLFSTSYTFANDVKDTDTKTHQAHSVAELISEHKALYPGEQYYIGLDIKLDPKWHTYWINPGDSASASIFKFKDIKGVTIGDPIYPTPQRYKVGPFYSFGYEDRVLIQFPIQISKNYNKRQIPIELSAEWLVCQEECIPGFYDFKMTLPAPPAPDEYTTTEKQAAKLALTNPIHKNIFEESRQSWPQQTFVATITDLDDTSMSLSFPNIEGKVVDIFPFPGLNISNEPPALQTSENTDTLIYIFKKEKKSTSQQLNQNFLVSYRSSDGALKSHILTSETDSNVSDTLILMLAFGFLGGLILNLMPCVFPILMLKVFQVVNSHQEKTATRSLLLYVLGVLISFWTLAVIILILQSAGHVVGWGFQLQSPSFTIFLIALFTLMGTYFLGFLPTPSFKFLNIGQGVASRQDHVGAFFTGVLAVVVASPCTAPFMGAAMGYALSRPAIEVLAIFTSLGVGLSFPFLLLAIFPKSLSWLPKPGMWMVYFKKLMALPLLATALWLSWVLVQQLTPVQTSDGYWETYSPTIVEDLQKQQPVFVNFTASWCISCQVNEKVAFQDDSVKQFISDNNIKMLKADWTKKNPEIAQILKSYGRAGVPMYLFYTPKSNQAIVLPEVLTPQILIKSLQKELQ